MSPEFVSALDGPELEQSVADGDGCWLAVASGPSAEPGADPGCEGEGAGRVGVLLPLGLAFEAVGDGGDGGLVGGVEDIGDRPLGGAVAVAHRLEDVDGGDQRGEGELLGRRARGRA